MAACGPLFHPTSVLTISVLYHAHPCMECSLDISNFVEEISSIYHSVFPSVFLHCSSKKAFLSLLVILWNSAFTWVYLSLSLSPFASLLSSAISKASRDSHFCLLAFLFLSDIFGHLVIYSALSLCPYFFRHSTRSNPLNILVISIV